MSGFTVKSFYSFTPIASENLNQMKEHLCNLSELYEVTGLVILATEGINTTLSGRQPKLDNFINEVIKLLKLGDLEVKTSDCDKPAFKRFTVKLRDEIVTYDRPDYLPEKDTKRRHISPTQWDSLMEDPNTVVIDTRNAYETVIGKFKNAIDPNIDEFTDYPEKIKSMNLDKDKNYLIYCTGGIRCEKAIYTMEEQGFKNVYQLDGGILNYLKEKPNKNFEGECFVFDSRVAVDQNLEPSKQFSLCPHCGEVASEEITCKKCDSKAKICPSCFEKIEEVPELETCSKNCSYHYKRDPHSKSPQQKRFYHFDQHTPS